MPLNFDQKDLNYNLKDRVIEQVNKRDLVDWARGKIANYEYPYPEENNKTKFTLVSAVAFAREITYRTFNQIKL